MRSARYLCLWVSLLSAADTAKEAFERAVRALTASDYPGAERGFQAVLREEPGNVAAISNLGVIYSRIGRADQAITMYRRALELSPDDKALLVNLGLVYFRQEDHKRALPLFERVVTLDPKHLQARQLAAVCRAYSGEPAAAIRDLEALRVTAPRDENILFLLGFVYLKNHEPEKAKAVFDGMFETAGPVRTQFLAGKANYEAALFAQAEENFLQVLRLDPGFPGVHLELGKVYISLRRNEDAVRELKLVLKANPGDGDASYFLGGLLIQTEQYTEGIPYLERAKTAKPDFWAPYFYLGKAKLRMDHPADAVVLLRRAVELAPDEASAYYLLGRAYKACGRTAEAAEALRRVQALRAGALDAASLDDGRVAGAK